MRFSMLSLVPLALLGCGDKDEDTSALVDGDGDGFTSAFDCDDSDAAINPGADELCDGADNNCNGETDESPADGTLFYADTDGDGYGNPDVSLSSCDASVQGYTDNSDDCDDSSNTAYPGGVELCDGLDNDCNGDIDDGAGDILTFYEDADGDGYGNPDAALEACAAPSGYVADAKDCDDANADISPETLWYPDRDTDGYGRSTDSVVSCEQPTGYSLSNLDCDDEDAGVNPDATEVCDGVDTNCDGKQDNDDLDIDLDGQAPCEGDCDDFNDQTYYGAIEVCDDGFDNDCDGRLNDTCPGSVYDADLTITGGSSYAYMGYGGDIGDIDGDGNNDLLIGAYGATVDGSSYAGEAYIFLGPLSGGSMDSGSADLSISGTETYEYLGSHINHGDLDGDGFDDLIVQARDTSYTGALYVFYGPVTASADSEAADAVIVGANSSDYLGYYGFDVADINGDGSDEVIAGAHYYDNDGTYSTGMIGIWSSPDGEMDVDDSDAWFTSTVSYAYVGYGFTASGDLDGDGAADIAWSEPGEDMGYINYGPINGEYDSGSADIFIYGQYNDYTGSRMASGDVNGDGYDDLIVGSQYSNGYYGSFTVFHGPISGDLYPNKDANYTVIGVNSYDYVGYSLDGVKVGDVDGDGNDDLAFGNSYYDNSGYSSSGGLFLDYGPLTGTKTIIDVERMYFPDATYAYTGRGVVMGDIDGDGATDIGVGAYGLSSYAGQYFLFFNSQL